MIRIALNVHYLRDGVFRLVAQRVNDDATTHRTVRTRAARFAGARDFQTLGLGVNRGEVESQCGKAGSASDGAFKEGPAGEFHRNLRQSTAWIYSPCGPLGQLMSQLM